MKLLTSIKAQFSIMVHKRNFRFSFSFLLFFSLLSYIINLIMNRNIDISRVYAANFLYLGNDNSNLWGVFSFLLPFIVVFPFATSYMEDKELKNESYVMGRFGKRNYFKSKYICAFIGGAIIIFIPLLVNLILCHITFPHNNITPYGPGFYEDFLGTNVIRETVQAGKPFLELYYFSPILYDVFYLCIVSIFSGLMSVFTLSCSFYIKKHKIFLFIPNFLIFYLFTAIDTLSYNNESLTYVNFNLADYLSIDSFYGLSVVFFLTFESLLLIFSIISYFYICKKEEI